MPGKSRSRLCAMTLSSGTHTVEARIWTKRGIPAPTGTLTRAREACSSLGWRSVTSRFSERLEMKGKGWAGSVAWGVTSG